MMVKVVADIVGCLLGAVVLEQQCHGSVSDSQPIKWSLLETNLADDDSRGEARKDEDRT